MTCYTEWHGWPTLSVGVDYLFFQVACGAGDLLFQLEQGVNDPVSQGDLLFQAEHGVDVLISQVEYGVDDLLFQLEHGVVDLISEMERSI